MSYVGIEERRKMGRGKHAPMDTKARKAKYTARFAITEHNKKRNIEKMKQVNPNWPDKKN